MIRSSRPRAACCLLPALCCLLTSGCGGRDYKVVPVSGRVTLDGNPIADVRIIFQPSAAGRDNPNAGPGSFGKTDAEGRFALRTIQTAEDGAVPGKHVVRMTTIAPAKNLSEDAPVPVENILPKQCLDGSMLFEVPLNGTEEANFELASQ